MMTNQSECESSCTGILGKLREALEAVLKEKKRPRRKLCFLLPGLEQLSTVSEWESFFLSKDLIYIL